jgi:hypothetical protein
MMPFSVAFATDCKGESADVVMSSCENRGYDCVTEQFNCSIRAIRYSCCVELVNLYSMVQTS